VRLLSYIGVFLLFVRASVGQTAGTPSIVSGNVGTSSSQAITSEGRLKMVHCQHGRPSEPCGWDHQCGMGHSVEFTARVWAPLGRLR
jgi:hypothetical protein